MSQPPDLAQAPLHAPSSTGPTCRGTSRQRQGRQGLCGVLPCCHWAGSSSTSAAAGTARAAGAVQGVLVWAISSCVSDRAMVSPGRQAGRCKRTPCGSSWWWRMCLLQSMFLEMVGRPADRCRLTGGQFRPTDRAMAVRSACTSPSEEGAEEAAKTTALPSWGCGNVHPCSPHGHKNLINRLWRHLLSNNLLLSVSSVSSGAPPTPTTPRHPQRNSPRRRHSCCQPRHRARTFGSCSFQMHDRPDSRAAAWRHSATFMRLIVASVVCPRSLVFLTTLTSRCDETN